MPDWKPEVRRRLANLKLAPTREAAIIEELTAHLEDCYAEWLAGGATPAEAERRTLTELSESEILARELRRVERQVAPEPIMLGTNRRKNMIADLWQDLRFGARTLMKQPTFTLIAVMTLALGIGANTAIFSVINAVLLKPLPYSQPEQLVMVYGEFPALKTNQMSLSVPEYTDFQQQTRSFAASGVFDGSGSANLAPHEGGEPERVERAMLTPEMFAVLQVGPLLGRVFTPEDAQQGQDDVVVLSHGLWQRRFAGRADAVGQKLMISGRSHTIIGVMPPGFAFPPKAEMWQPLWFPKEMYDQQRRGSRGLEALARLKPGVSLTAAQAELDQLGGRLTAQYPQNYRAERRYRMLAAPLLEDYVGELKPALLLLLGAVGFVLLITCANVANLLLARAATRQQEIAVRLALGAGRGRLMRQLLTESVLLAAAGGAVGLLLAVWGLAGLRWLNPGDIPRLSAIAIDGRALAFTSAVVLLTGILFGLAPALRSSQVSLGETLKEGGRSMIGGHHRLRNLLVVAEIALSLVLLISAGLLIRSFIRVQQVEPGFAPRNVLSMRLALVGPAYSDEARRVSFYQQLWERVRGLPGVESAGGIGWGSITIEGYNPSSGQSMIQADQRVASVGYFETMKIPLISGRFFTEQDARESMLAVIVDENMARSYWPNTDPVGKRLKRGREDSNAPWMTVVGVVATVKHYALDADSRVALYTPHRQSGSGSLSIAARTTTDPVSVAAAITREARTIDPNLPVYDVKTMEQWLSESLARRRFAMLSLGLFALVAMILAAVGIYGVMSYSVAQRTREIGIRVALGAQTRNVLKLVISQGMLLAGVGVGVGLAAALAITRVMGSLLFGVGATDPLTFAAIALLLAGVALLACWIPARRAAKVDPMIALRYE